MRRSFRVIIVENSPHMKVLCEREFEDFRDAERFCEEATAQYHADRVNHFYSISGKVFEVKKKLRGSETLRCLRIYTNGKRDFTWEFTQALARFFG